jgi:hypothetical protein
VMSAEPTSREILLGLKSGDHVSIRVLGRMHPGSRDYWDGNWLISPIEVVAGGFRAETGAGLRADELVRFREALEKLYSTLAGEATFESLEGWLHLRLTVDLKGSLSLAGRIVDRPGAGNILSFTIGGLDQTHLPQVISALIRSEEAFPVLGIP